MMVVIFPGETLFWVATVLSSLGLLAALVLCPWRAFFQVRPRSVLWLGYWLVLTFVWSLRIPMGEIMAMHLTALAPAVFIFGAPLALLLASLALVSSQLLQPLTWQVLPLNWLLGVLLPVAGAWLARVLVNRLPLNNLFVFILGGGFGGSILMVVVTVAGSLMFLSAFSVPSLVVVLQDHLWLFGLSAFPEGFIGGAVLSTITVLWPGLVKNYDDQRYLSN